MQVILQRVLGVVDLAEQAAGRRADKVGVRLRMVGDLVALPRRILQHAPMVRLRRKSEVAERDEEGGRQIAAVQRGERHGPLADRPVVEGEREGGLLALRPAQGLDIDVHPGAWFVGSGV